MTPAPGRITVRPLTPDDDLEPDLELSHRAFGPFGAEARERRLASARLTVAAGAHLAAFDGGTQVASGRYLDLRQWWRGRVLPLAGVAGVKVAPHEQGRGLGRAVMTEMLQQMAARGYPLSALYPATVPLYRSLGWEMAGGLYVATIPARSLRALVPADPGSGPAAEPGPATGGPVFRPAGPDDAAQMISVLSDLHAAGQDCGPVTFSPPFLAGVLGNPDVYAYLAPDGVLIYQWDTARDEMLLTCAAAGSAATGRALWAIVSSHGTIVKGIRAVVSPADPVSWLTREPDVTLTRAEMWMLRLLDAPAAIAGRGFSPAVTLAAGLAVTDPQLPANSGEWHLEISGGTAALTAARSPRPDSLRLGARGLAALYAGTPLATLRRAGLAGGGTPAADAALNDAFAATPYMTDNF